MIPTFSASTISSRIPKPKDHNDDIFGFSSRKQLKSTGWTVCDPESSTRYISLSSDVGLSNQAQFILDTYNLTFNALVPVRVPGLSEVRSCQNSVGIFYKYCSVKLIGSIFNPPRPFLMKPLQLAIDEAIRRNSNRTDCFVRYTLLSKARDSLIFFVHETKASNEQYYFPEFFSYPHVPSRDSSSDATNRLSPSLVSPSLPDELVQLEIVMNDSNITTLFVPSVSGGVAHIVSDSFVAFSTETGYWKLFRSGSSDEPESVSISCPPNDSSSEQIVEFFKRMRFLVNHNNRILDRMSSVIPTITSVSPRFEFYPHIGSFNLSETGHVSCVFRDRVRLSFQLAGTTIDREYGSVSFLLPSGDTEELTWNFLLGNRHEGYQTYEFYISCALRFVYDSLKPVGGKTDELIDSFDETQINNVLDNTIRMIELIRG